jgi:integrase
MKFTKASVAALTLPAGKSDHFVWDDATPGFGVRLREPDKKIWYAQLRVHGHTKRLALGDVARIDLEPARSAAKRFFAEATLGQDPVKARAEARAKAAITVGNTIEKFIAAKESASRPNTRRHRERFLRKFFAPLHSTPLDAVTRRDVAAAIADIAEAHGLISAKHSRAALNTFYLWSVKEGYAESNPVALTNDPAPGYEPRERVLKPSEIRAIWSSLPATPFGQVVRLLFYTACRRSEIAGLEWSEVDFAKAMLVIPGNKTKNHRAHRLPLAPEAVEILQSIPRQPDSPFVFGGRRGFTTFSYCLGELQKCLAATGGVVEHWTLHDVRRTARSELGELGVQPWIGEQILNHARAGIEGTDNWAKLEKQMRQALDQWADRLRSIVDETESTVVALRA